MPPVILELVTPPFILANSEDPDEMPQSVAFHQIFTIVYGFSVYNRLIQMKFFNYCFGLVYCLMSKSTAMVMSGRSVHLTTLFPGQA